MRRLTRAFKRTGRNDHIIIVSGLPRSGTSLMMKMLEAGGVPPLTDGIRRADADNPRGYYEFERAKKLHSGDGDWLDDAEGKSVKIIATLLYDLPPAHRYRIVFMRRRMSEILDSQRQMLLNRGEDPDLVSDDDMARIFERHLERLRSWLETRPDISVLEIDYNALVDGGASEYAQEVGAFVGGNVDAQAMAEVVEPDLYRQRRALR